MTEETRKCSRRGCTFVGTLDHFTNNKTGRTDAVQCDKCREKGKRTPKAKVVPQLLPIDLKGKGEAQQKCLGKSCKFVGTLDNFVDKNGKSTKTCAKCRSVKAKSSKEAKDKAISTKTENGKVCRRCLKAKPLDEYNSDVKDSTDFCIECRVKRAKGDLDRKAKKVDNKCSKCLTRNKEDPTAEQCLHCQTLGIKAAKIRRDKALNKNLCVECLGARDTDRKTCSSCRQRFNKNAALRKTNPKCALVQLIQYYVDLKSDKSCLHCGIDNWKLLDFDHIDPKTKKKVVRYCTSVKEMCEEVQKCQLLCGNCHAIKTHTVDVKLKKDTVLQKEAMKSRFKRHRGRAYINRRKMELGGKCTQCNFDATNRLYCLQFDHIDPKTKKKSVCELVGFSEEVIEEEIQKCRLLCVNCHRLRTTLQHEYHVHLGVDYTNTMGIVELMR